MSCRGLSERGGGTVFATYFLLDPEVERALGEGRTWRVMPHLESDPELGSYRLADRGAPSEAVASRRRRGRAREAGARWTRSGSAAGAVGQTASPPTTSSSAASVSR
jgi:hypothetical protein